MATENEFTKTPNFIFEIMPQLSPAEFKVIMVVVRQTCGYHKEIDAISLTQFMQATALSRQGVLNAIASLVEKGFLVKCTIGNTFKYSVKIVNSVDQSTELTGLLSRPELVNSVDQFAPKLVNSVDLQKKVFKEKKRNTATQSAHKAQRQNSVDETSATTKVILDAYIEVRGKNGINYGKEGKAAKKIADEGGTPELVKGCYAWLKQDKFWEFKTLGLSKIHEQLPDYQRYLERTATTAKTKIVNGRETLPDGFKVVSMYGPESET